jgi:glycosyltransferase involved in cell wall biosynthesis
MKEKNENPLVSVALPVFNEERYIAETLTSVLQQDYTNLEVIILDNCSTDDTGKICRAFAEQDHRIRYHCHEKNIGVGPNHISSFNIARGKYFMWAAGHDRWSENFISQSVRSLEKFQSATIAFGTPKWIDCNGEPIKKYSGWYDTRGLNSLARFLMVFWGSMNPILGLFRRESMPADISDYNFAGADLVILGELSLKGEFIHASNTSYYRRQNRPAETHIERMDRYKSAKTNIGDSVLLKLFPLAKIPLELIRVIFQSKIETIEKILLLIILIPMFPVRYIMGIRDKSVS